MLKKPFVFIVTKIVVGLFLLMFLFFIVGLLTTTKPSSRLTTNFLTNWTSHFEQSVFTNFISMENRPFALLQEKEDEPSPFSFKTFLHIQLKDFKHLVGKELPGFATYEKKIIIAGEQMDDISGQFHESGPPIEDILEEREAIDETKDVEQVKEKSDLSKKRVFLYSSHNRESFLPHLPKETNPDRAYHQEVNITKVSERLASQLEKNKIGASFDDTDITTILHEKGWTYGKSYEASRPVVQNALEKYEDIEYVFDIHRDSLPYDKTTKTIHGTSYATFLFVIGAENKHYEKNLQLATELHYLLEEKLPGISRGVITKEGPHSNGVYNQDLLENAILIEVGGYDNHLEEMYRSIDEFAQIFSDFYWQAEKVNK